MFSSMFPFGILSISMIHGLILIVSWCLFFNPLLQDSSEKPSLSDKQVEEIKEGSPPSSMLNRLSFTLQIGLADRWTRGGDDPIN